MPVTRHSRHSHEHIWMPNLYRAHHSILGSKTLREQTSWVGKKRGEVHRLSYSKGMNRIRNLVCTWTSERRTTTSAASSSGHTTPIVYSQWWSWRSFGLAEPRPLPAAFPRSTCHYDRLLPQAVEPPGGLADPQPYPHLWPLLSLSLYAPQHQPALRYTLWLEMRKVGCFKAEDVRDLG